MAPEPREHVTLVEVLERTTSRETFTAAATAFSRRLETEGVRALITLQFYLDPDSAKVGVLLTFADAREFVRHVAMIASWEEFRTFAATVRVVDIRVYGRLTPEAKAWIGQFGGIGQTFAQHVTGFVRSQE